MFELFMMICLFGIGLSQLIPQTKTTDNADREKAAGTKANYRSDRRSDFKRAPVRRYQRQAESARTPLNCSGGIGRLK